MTEEEKKKSMEDEKKKQFLVDVADCHSQRSGLLGFLGLNAMVGAHSLR